MIFVAAHFVGFSLSLFILSVSIGLLTYLSAKPVPEVPRKKRTGKMRRKQLYQ